VHQDIAAFLDTADTRHDLVVATDVFIYIGDLAPVFAGIGRAVDAGGLFCFSVETLPKSKPGDFELQPTLRFAHSEAYARRLAAEHGFEVIDTVRAPLRQDQRQAIDGLFIFLRKRAT
jgi:predicted TPR repeat methyltransferase